MTNAQISNAALDLVVAGDVPAAWAMAQRDTGLGEHVTLYLWLAWAHTTIRNRAAIARAYAA